MYVCVYVSMYQTPTLIGCTSVKINANSSTKTLNIGLFKCSLPIIDICNIYINETPSGIVSEHKKGVILPQAGHPAKQTAKVAWYLIIKYLDICRQADIWPSLQIHSTHLWSV